MQRKLSALSFFIVCLLQSVAAQEIQFELVKSNGPILVNAGFELVEVLNQQANLTSIGSIYNASNKLNKVVIKNGLTVGLRSFYGNSLQKSNIDRKIQLRVQDFKIVEKPQNSKVVSGELKIRFAYFLKGSFDPVHLVDYEAGISYQRSMHRTDLINQILNRGVTNSMVFFNDWIKDHATFDRKLAKSVRLEIVEKSRKSDNDTVFYDSKRPLTWDNFLDRPNRISKNNAMIFTSLAMEGSPYMDNGVLILPIEIKVYMLPGSSWIRSGGQNEYSLNHEQRHFDITRVVGNRLVNRLKTLDLNPENYEAEVNDAFFDSFREMNKLQEIYDARTRHGMDRTAQLRWNTILDQALNGETEDIEKELLEGK